VEACFTGGMKILDRGALFKVKGILSCYASGKLLSFTFSHLADAFIQSDLQLRTKKSESS